MNRPSVGSGVSSLRVMPSFGQPRPTTNPYIVMLGRSLADTQSIEVVPFSWRTALAGHYDVFHLQWAEVLIASPSFLGRARKRAQLLALVALWRLRKTTVVRTVHNLDMRESGRVERLIVGLAERSAVHEIHLNEVSFTHAKVPATLIPHGDYRDWFAEYARQPRLPARVGFVGLIRPYKGVEALTRAFAEAKATNGAMSLQLAGRTSSAALAHTLTRFAAGTADVGIELEYVSDQRMVEIITSSTLVVLPYTQMDNSGAAIAALSLSRPVLVPRNPTTRALANEVGESWVQLFDGELSAASLLSALESTARLGADDSPRFNDRDWSSAGIAHRDAYTAALTTRGKRVNSDSPSRPKKGRR